MQRDRTRDQRQFEVALPIGTHTETPWAYKTGCLASGVSSIAAGFLEQGRSVAGRGSALRTRRAASNAVDALVVDLLGEQSQTELLAHHASEEAAHGVRLPSRRLRDVLVRSPAGPPQQAKNMILFGIAALAMSDGLADSRLRGLHGRRRLTGSCSLAL